MKRLNKKYFNCTVLLLIMCFLVYGCSPDKEFKFAFNRKDGETYIQKLSISMERYISPTNIKMDDTLSETRVTCNKIADGWEILSQPVNRIIYQNGKEVKNPLLSMLSEFVITYKLNEDGEIKDVGGYEKVLEAIESQYPSDLDKGILSSLDINALKQREFAEWNRRIGDFLNKKFSIGDVWESETSSALQNGEELSYRVKTHFKELVQHKSRRCILIEQTYDSTGKGITDFISSIAKMDPIEKNNYKYDKIKDGKVSSSIIGKVTRLIDPSTMNIYKEEAERTIHMEMDISGFGKIPIKIVETRSYDYEYGR